MTLLNELYKLEACDPAIDWVRENAIASLDEAWSKCNRPEWMMWLLVRKTNDPGWPSLREIMHWWVFLAETAFKGQTIGLRAGLAIDILECYTRGGESVQDIKNLVERLRRRDLFEKKDDDNHDSCSDMSIIKICHMLEAYGNNQIIDAADFMNCSILCLLQGGLNQEIACNIIHKRASLP